MRLLRKMDYFVHEHEIRAIMFEEKTTDDTPDTGKSVPVELEQLIGALYNLRPQTGLEISLGEYWRSMGFVSGRTISADGVAVGGEVSRSVLGLKSHK